MVIGVVINTDTADCEPGGESWERSDEPGSDGPSRSLVRVYDEPAP